VSRTPSGAYGFRWRLLQHYRHISELPRCLLFGRLQSESGHAGLSLISANPEFELLDIFLAAPSQRRHAA